MKLFRRPSYSPYQQSRPLLLFWIALLLFVSFLSGFVIALGVVRSSGSDQYAITANSVKDITYFDDKLYGQVYGLIKNNYLDKTKLDDKKLFYGALQGMVAAVGDPYTVFFDPTANNQFNEELSGQFGGIGAELGTKQNRLTVISPLAGSPAEKAGIRAGDVILSIDAKETGSMTLDEAVALIRGKTGTTVKLTIYRDDGTAKTHVITVTRAIINVPTVTYKRQDSIAIINLDSFNNESEKQFVTTLRTVVADNPKGLILDLRNNPGGFLDKAVDIASAWIQKGQVVVREVYRDEKLSKQYDAIDQVAAPRVPMIVLVNEGTASAAEILAGALQDYGIAKLIGTKTYGKGSVQDLKSLPDGSGLKITISQWITPKGRFINHDGIEPDVNIPLTSDDAAAGKDPQLDKALELMHTYIQ